MFIMPYHLYRVHNFISESLLKPCRDDTINEYDGQDSALCMTQDVAGGDHRQEDPPGMDVVAKCAIADGVHECAAPFRAIRTDTKHTPSLLNAFSVLVSNGGNLCSVIRFYRDLPRTINRIGLNFYTQNFET